MAESLLWKKFHAFNDGKEILLVPYALTLGTCTW